MGKREDKQKYIAYCGLYCEDCPWHTGKIADFARDLRKELRNARFDKLAEFIAKLAKLAPSTALKLSGFNKRTVEDPIITLSNVVSRASVG